jgi:GNAT superfamily N-acetyltransferase
MPQIRAKSAPTAECRQVSNEQVIALRHAELRAGLPVETANFDGDAAPTTFHFGAFLQGETVGCASFMLNQYEGLPAYQLRGMATRADLIGRGIGRSLLEFGQQTLLEQTPIRLLWCNARVPAIGFYEKQGWRVVSEVFEVPTAGPHRRMTKQL